MFMVALRFLAEILVYALLMPFKVLFMLAVIIGLIRLRIKEGKECAESAWDGFKEGSMQAFMREVDWVKTGRNEWLS